MPRFSIPVNILIVEDSPTQALQLQRMLEQQGYGVIHAVNGRLALEAMQKSNPTLIISDVIMPEMDGYEFCRRVKADKATRGIPFIIVTTMSDPHEVIRGLECGADNFILKPYEEETLLGRVQFMLLNRGMIQNAPSGGDDGVEIVFSGERHVITADRLQILNLLISTYDAAIQTNKDLTTAQAALRHVNAELGEANNLLEIEQAKSHNLMLNILPEPIAARLMEGELDIAERYTDVTILFADIVNFTKLSSHTDPVDLVALLNDIFTRFDALAEKHGLEKIKTIGDCYMVVGGLPVARPDHAEAVAAMALDMIRVIKEVDSERGIDLDVRIGINSGPVVAGVIGRKKFTYDLWGHTVNLASRMESSGAAGKIQVSHDTQQLLATTFDLIERGNVVCKGIGEVRAYFLDNKRKIIDLQ